MWVALRDCMIADNEPPLPSTGSVLRSMGVRVSGTLSAAEAGAVDAVDEVSTTVESVPWLVEYVFTGTAGQARDVDIHGGGGGGQHSGAEFVLAIDGHRFQVRFDSWGRDLHAGSRVAVRGQLSLVADYEWDAFQLIDSRADWRVRDVVVLDAGCAMLDLDYA
jgi:hypothetical protein